MKSLWQIAFDITLIASMAGCSSQPNDSIFLDDISGFSLACKKMEENIGVLPKGEQREATFDIENSGTISVLLELGASSCTCTKVELSRNSIAPGEKAILTMGLLNNSGVGPISARVPLYAKGQQWAHTFTVYALGVGSWFPDNEIVLSKESPDYLLKGVFYSADPETQVDAVVSIRMQNGANALVQMQGPELSKAQSESGGYYQEIQFNIQLNKLHLSNQAIPTGSRWAGTLSISVSADGQPNEHIIPVSVWSKSD